MADPAPLDFNCPTCGARSGTQCHTLPIPGLPLVRTNPHKARLQLAIRAKR